jgi:DNA polymerase III delta prime subunit
MVENFISEALSLDGLTIQYETTRKLVAMFPNRKVMVVNQYGFDAISFAHAGHCKLEENPDLYNLYLHYWRSIEPEDEADYDEEPPEIKPGKVYRTPIQVWYKVLWQDHNLDLLQIKVGNETLLWLIADSYGVGQDFYAAVCGWEAEIRQEVLVFDNGRWRKDPELFQAIKSATFDNLVLPATLKNGLRDDLARFFASKELYTRYTIPWRRGVLLVGPPGNGKTHAIKALSNSLGKPCIYVKSFRSEYGTDENNIHAVYEKAREIAPCLLILEDLDAQINDRNRSFFLNELDGFAGNAGILTVATTNHPEKLDSAIVNRPSRFDRKYHFDLPQRPERFAYIEMWNNTMQTELRLSEAGVTNIADATNGFSFAYLKELFVSSMMGWIGQEGATPMDSVMVEQVSLLHEQMVTTNTAPALANADEESLADDEPVRHR